MDECTEAMRDFFRKYLPLQKKYDLRMNTGSKCGRRERSWIEIWEYINPREKRRVCKFKEEDMETCWRKAAVMLDTFKWREEEPEIKTG